MDRTVVDFEQFLNQKRHEEQSIRSSRAVRLYLAIVLAKIELITNQNPHNTDIFQKVCRCLDVANEELLSNKELIDKYGSDEDTPSIQLFMINNLINRTIELYFGEIFQADKL